MLKSSTFMNKGLGKSYHVDYVRRGTFKDSVSTPQLLYSTSKFYQKQHISRLISLFDAKSS